MNHENRTAFCYVIMGFSFNKIQQGGEFYSKKNKMISGIEHMNSMDEIKRVENRRVECGSICGNLGVGGGEELKESKSLEELGFRVRACVFEREREREER